MNNWSNLFLSSRLLSMIPIYVWSFFDGDARNLFQQRPILRVAIAADLSPNTATVSNTVQPLQWNRRIVHWNRYQRNFFRPIHLTITPNMIMNDGTSRSTRPSILPMPMALSNSKTCFIRPKHIIYVWPTIPIRLKSLIFLPNNGAYNYQIW